MEVQRLAALARAAYDNYDGPPSRTNDEARARPGYAEIMRLRDALIDELGDQELADRVVSRWFITRRPVLECIEEARREPVGGWPVTPSPSGRLGSPTGEKGQGWALPRLPDDPPDDVRG